MPILCNGNQSNYLASGNRAAKLKSNNISSNNFSPLSDNDFKTNIPRTAIKLLSTHSVNSSNHYQPYDQNSARNNFKYSNVPEKICIGTNNRLSAPSQREHHYQNLRDRYTNCTYIDGNLEITWLQDSNYNLSFLKTIQEVTGYVLIAMVDVERIQFHSLSIIRGRELFKTTEGEFALMITSSKMRYIEMPALQDIVSGSVGIVENENLCYMDKIDWETIIDDTSRYRTYKVFSNSNLVCPPCHSSCNDQCWSDSQNMCQQTQPYSCHQKCASKRCYGHASTQCCHPFCVGGCNGPSERDCFACRNFYNEGECMQECPSINRYNPVQFQWEPNPLGRYAHGSTCVKECPGHLLRDNGACVKKCPPNKRSQGDECISCVGPCPKECQGVDTVHSGNIEQLSGCTVIEGSISILQSSFDEYTEFNSKNTSMMTHHPPMSPNRLEALKTIRNITGFLNIQADHPEFKNLSFLRNLEIIGGRQTNDMFALSIMKTSLVSLNLRSLKKIRAGGVNIEENKDLCFADTMNWSEVNISSSVSMIIKNNGNKTECAMKGLLCHLQCDQGGCSGPGQDECSSCKNYKFEDFCVNNCSATNELHLLSYDVGGKTCVRCHEECKNGCFNSKADGCFSCKNVKDGRNCVANCPKHKFSFRGECQDCDKSCLDGCTGPSNKLGPGGCIDCAKSVLNSSDPNLVSHCIMTDDRCPDGHYEEYVTNHTRGEGFSYNFGRAVCRRCHQRCKRCKGMGTHISVCECAKYTANDQCEDLCPRDSYADEKSRKCIKCSPECIGCKGPTEADCLTCRAYRIYHGDINPTSSSFDSLKMKNKFNCTDKCPSSKPYRTSGIMNLDPYCSDKPDASFKRDSFYTSTSLIFLCLASATAMICFLIYRCQIEKDRAVKLAMHLKGTNDSEPLNPSNIKPNRASLRILRETELRKGELLGAGFGGEVYKAMWYPPEGNALIPVAIKVLRDNGISNMNKEFLEEAYTMSLVNHKNLVKLLGVCMTPNELMLVTPLHPLGCLLNHVVNNVDGDFKPKNLLEWCKQIAEGMAYLEENRIVHRDLALRNVLLNSDKRALITDFGLAKLLEINQYGYHSSEGRLPIKWLAPECLSEKIFTHKSDVWAFGVTVWELLTQGRKPFEEYETEEVPAAIEEGARLKQPANVTTEVYRIMLACWIPSSEGRPNFKELYQSFVKFASDPSRYLLSGVGFENPSLPTDVDDYLVPSPSIKGETRNESSEALFKQPRSAKPTLFPFPSCSEQANFNVFPLYQFDQTMISTAPTSPVLLPSPMRPPHSAGAIKVENEEYFVDRINNGLKTNYFFSSTGALDDKKYTSTYDC